MGRQYFLSVVLLFAVLSVGDAVISNENIEKSSGLHVRKKRVINHSPGGVQPANSRHLVQILVADTFECAGSILQADIIITTRNCLYGSNDQYTVLSGSLMKNRGNRHRVVATVKHIGSTNLALLKIAPPIGLSSRGSKKINLYSGRDIPYNKTALLSGWGCTNITPRGERIVPQHLMAALLPIISHQQCFNAIQASHGRLPGPDVICTLDVLRERGACFGDEGGSLVYDGQLLGIYSHNQGVDLGVHPDIYVNLYHEDLVRWIRTNSHELQMLHGRN